MRVMMARAPHATYFSNVFAKPHFANRAEAIVRGQGPNVRDGVDLVGRVEQSRQGIGVRVHILVRQGFRSWRYQKAWW
jgi:hypothetical protein